MPDEHKEDMYPHPNGGGLVAETAFVEDKAYVAPLAIVTDNAYVDGTCEIYGSSVVAGNATLTNKTILKDSAYVCGDAELANVVIHGNARIDSTPIVVHGFEHQVIVSDTHILIGCMSMNHAQWEARGVAFLRGNGYPRFTSENLHAIISNIIQCKKSLYHREDVVAAYTGQEN